MTEQKGGACPPPLLDEKDYHEVLARAAASFPRPHPTIIERLRADLDRKDASGRRVFSALRRHLKADTRRAENVLFYVIQAYALCADRESVIAYYGRCRTTFEADVKAIDQILGRHATMADADPPVPLPINIETALTALRQEFSEQAASYEAAPAKLNINQKSNAKMLFLRHLRTRLFGKRRPSVEALRLLAAAALDEPVSNDDVKKATPIE